MTTEILSTTERRELCQMGRVLGEELRELFPPEGLQRAQTVLRGDISTTQGPALPLVQGIYYALTEAPTPQVTEQEAIS